MLRAIVFDFDGVIANSEPLHFRAFRDVLADQGVDLAEQCPVRLRNKITLPLVHPECSLDVGCRRAA